MGTTVLVVVTPEETQTLLSWGFLDSSVFRKAVSVLRVIELSVMVSR